MSEQRKAWTTYILLRLAFFVVPFGALYALGLSMGMSMKLSGIVAAVIAALIGVSLSMLVLSKPRERASESIYEWRNRARTADDIEEDAVLDEAVAAEAAGEDAATGESALADAEHAVEVAVENAPDQGAGSQRAPERDH